MTPHPHHPIEDLTRSRSQKLLKAITSYYAIALAVAAVCAVIFGWLAEEVLEKEFTSTNTSILLAIHAHDTPTLDTLALDITNFGSAIGIAIIGAMLAGGILLMKRYVDLGTFAGVLIGSTIISVAFKLLFHQVRPAVFISLAPETSYSFPSGHSMSSFSVWGFFAWWIISLGPKDIWRWVLAILGIVIAIFVALSRLYLGVHFPSDVLVGTILGWIIARIAFLSYTTYVAPLEQRARQWLRHRRTGGNAPLRARQAH